MSPKPYEPLLVAIALCTLVPSSVLAESRRDDVETDPASAQVSTAPPPSDSAARDKVERDLSRLLATPELGFCKDLEIARAQVSNRACELARAHARQRCPALEKACGTALVVPPPEPAAHPSSPPTDTRHDAPLTMPSALGSVLFWGLLILLLLFIARSLLSVFQGLAAAPAPAPRKATEAGAPVEPRAQHQAQESDVDRLLARAEGERAQGRFEAAIATLYAALVHKLGQDQLITVEAARTNGDYLHELARRPNLQGSVRQVFRVVERTQFGGSEPSDEICRDLLSRILALVKRGAPLLLVLTLLTVPSACSSPGRGSAEHSPDGLYLMTELLKQNGTQVRRRVGAATKFEPDVEKVLVLADDVAPEVWTGVLAWTRGGGSLFVAQPEAELYRTLGVSIESAGVCRHPLVLGPPYDREKLEVIGVGRGRLHFDHALPDEASIDASCEGQPYIVTVPYGAGVVTLLESPGLLCNASLSVGDNAAFVQRLLGVPGFTLELVDDWTGSGESSPIRALQNAGMRPLLLELLAFMAVLIWRYGAGFGMRRDPNAPARRAFVDHVWALGRSYARARASRHALGLYSAFALEQLRERQGAGRPLGLIELAGELAQRTGRRAEDVMVLLTEAHEAAQGGELERGNATDLDTLQKLESLLYPSGGTP